MKKDKEKLARLLHDFKAPLSSTRMGIEFILEKRAGEINEKIEKLLKDILGRTEKLIDNILAFEEKNG